MPWAIDRVHTMSGVASLVGQTKLELLRLMMEEGGTAERLAARLHMNVSAVRRHLEALTKARLVEASFERRGRGRPSKIYKITLEGREVFGTGYDMLLIYLTGALLAKLGQGEAVKLMAETARSLAAGIRRGPGAGSYLPLLEQLGFRPMIMKRRGQLSLISRNCPVLRAAKEVSRPVLPGLSWHITFGGDGSGHSHAEGDDGQRLPAMYTSGECGGVAPRR